MTPRQDPTFAQQCPRATRESEIAHADYEPTSEGLLRLQLDTSPAVLVVDLDGTLLRSDMLYESFWSAFARDWRSPVLSAAALSKGRASLKRHLATVSAVDTSTLPYDSKVIAVIEAWRKSGGYTALVTASDQAFAEMVADHLGIFDEVHGSNGKLNLKGERKGRFLEERFGPKGFAYIGDSAADLPVWKRAAKAITVNAPAALRREAERACDTVEHLATEAASVKPYIKALRPHQWLKNVLVFLPMLAAHKSDGSTFLSALFAFICFSLVASSVYVLNDLLDLADDRAHPRKRNRPFASGSIPIAHGTWMAAGLTSLGIVLAAVIGWSFLLVMAGYYLLTTAYSLHLKRRIVIDICVLAGLYTTRIVAGGVATSTPLSVWLLAFSVFFFLSLAAVKRQAELVDSAERGSLESSGRGYHVDDLPIISMIAIGAGYVSVLVMMLYVNSPDVMDLYAQPEALWGVCAVVLYWITRTVMVSHRGHMHDDPVVYAAKDRISQLCLVIILAFVLWGALA
ncbi:UbiA family prenyltransferase [Rhodobacteraceae bacterium WD3A24]|nr:UbiA family prenyltransferase [Rhodobacteraceae bacterium WD3A24]